MLYFKKVTSPESVIDHLINDAYGDYDDTIKIDGGVYPDTRGPIGARRTKFKLNVALVGTEKHLRKGSAGLVDLYELPYSQAEIPVVDFYLYKKAHAHFGFTAERVENTNPLWVAALGVHNYLNGLNNTEETATVRSQIAAEYELQEEYMRSVPRLLEPRLAELRETLQGLRSGQ